MSSSDSTRIPVAKETHREARDLLRGNETWDSLIRKMSDAYDPEDYPPGELPRKGDRE